MLDEKRAARISTGLMLVLALAACSSSGGNDSGGPAPDSGTTGNPDATTTPDSGALSPDSGGVRDAGNNKPDSGEAHYCAVNNEIQVGTTQVSISPASAAATNAMGAASDTSCIDQPPKMGAFTAPIFIRGCIDVLAPANVMTTQTEINALDVAVFFAKDPSTHAVVDPSWDRASGQDKSQADRIPVRFSVDQGACPSHLQLSIGFQLTLANSLQSETEYIIRTRTSTRAGTTPGVWATMYFYGVIVRNQNVTGSGGQLAACTPEQCSLRHNFNLMRGAQLAALAGAAQTPGANDLNDGSGAGYGLIEAYDCSDTAMKSAVAAFSPAPLAKAYLDATGAMVANASSTGDSGLFLALGFMGQTAATNSSSDVVGAVGVERDTSCTEEFGGRTVTVFPDSVTVIRSSAETALHSVP